MTPMTFDVLFNVNSAAGDFLGLLSGVELQDRLLVLEPPGIDCPEFDRSSGYELLIDGEQFKHTGRGCYRTRCRAGDLRWDSVALDTCIVTRLLERLQDLEWIVVDGDPVLMGKWGRGQRIWADDLADAVQANA